MKQTQSQETLAEVQRHVEEALKLLDSETADAIIGEQTPEYGVLIRGVKAVMGMYWAVLKTLGLKETPASLKAAGQSLLMVATIVHYAYALGMQRGREEK